MGLQGRGALPELLDRSRDEARTRDKRALRGPQGKNWRRWGQQGQSRAQWKWGNLIGARHKGRFVQVRFRHGWEHF